MTTSGYHTWRFSGNKICEHIFRKKVDRWPWNDVMWNMFLCVYREYKLHSCYNLVITFLVFPVHRICRIAYFIARKSACVGKGPRTRDCGNHVSSGRNFHLAHCWGSFERRILLWSSSIYCGTSCRLRHFDIVYSRN